MPPVQLCRYSQFNHVGTPSITSCEFCFMYLHANIQRLYQTAYLSSAWSMYHVIYSITSRKSYWAAFHFHILMSDSWNGSYWQTDQQIEEFTQGLSKVRLIRCSMKYSHLQVYIYFRNFSPKRGHTITYRLEMCSYNYCVIHLFIKAFQIALIDNCVSNDIYLAMLRICFFSLK